MSEEKTAETTFETQEEMAAWAAFAAAAMTRFDPRNAALQADEMLAAFIKRGSHARVPNPAYVAPEDEKPAEDKPVDASASW